MSYISDELPEFSIDEENGIIRIDGMSLMDVAKEFYVPLIEEVKNYIDTSPVKVDIFINLQYFNTPSSKYILEMLKMFVPLHDEGCKILVHWYFEEDDEDMHEAGVDFNALVSIPFELIPTTFVRKDKL